MGLFSGLFGGSNIKLQPRKDRVNVVARYSCLLEDEFYIMILDFVSDRILIEKIKQKRLSKREVRSLFLERGDRINGRLLDYMDKLVPSLNPEDFYLEVDADLGDPYNVESGFFFVE